MPLRGTLKSWNDDRGFGFIAPTRGGRELFVHISAFPRDGSRPAVGESLTYEIGRGKDGKAQAVYVYRQALGSPSTYARTRPADVRRRRSSFAALSSLALLIVVGAYGYTAYQRQVQHTRLPSATSETLREGPVPTQGEYRCDGRTDCSQMTSCSEAKFFLENCPGTQMDGDNDGVPCEQQWCTSPSDR
jgi:cold shock CspA family protein